MAELELDDDSKTLLTMNTHKGLFMPNRLQFGVHCASGMFQRELEKQIGHIPFTIIRSDDILISGENDDDHLSNLASVLKLLSENGLRLNLRKCKFMAKEVLFLGYVISSKGVTPDRQKIEAILQMPRPENKTQLKSFLGMINYYHRHMKNMSLVLEPLHLLLRKDEKWHWGHSQQKAFDDTKRNLNQSQILTHYNPNKRLRITGDASPYGIGAVLSHVEEDGTENPIAFTSRSLSKSERNYSQIEKEALVIIYAVKKFHQYIYGLGFEIITDHKLLLGIISEDKGIPVHSASRIQRWALLLAAYNYKLISKSGNEIPHADCLSRLPLKNTVNEESRIANTIHFTEIDSSPVTSEDVSRYTSRDIVMSKVVDYTLGGWPENMVVKKEFQPYYRRRQELSVEAGCIIWGNRVVIPPQLRQSVLKEIHEAHPGITRAKSLCRCFCWWPKMDEEVENEIRSCRQCLDNQANPTNAPLHPWETATHPWTRLHVDYAGPFLGKMYLIIYDTYSKWIEAYPVSTASSPVTITRLDNCFATHGLPQIIVSDNASCFVSEEFTKYVKHRGIKHVTSAPYHPASNGAAERAVQTFKNSMKKMSCEAQSGTIANKINKFLFRYRITRHTVTGVSPAEMLMARRLRSRLTLLKPNMHNRQLRKQEDAIKNSPKAKMREFMIGDQVLARNYRHGSKWFLGVIVRRTGPVSYEIEIDGGIIRRHVDQVRRCNDAISKKMKSLEEMDRKDDTETSERAVERIVVPERMIEESTQSQSDTPTHNRQDNDVGRETIPANATSHSNTENDLVETNDFASPNVPNESANVQRRSSRTWKAPDRYQAGFS